MTRAERCCQTSYNAENISPQQMTCPRMSTVPRLRNPWMNAGRRECRGSGKGTCYERKPALVFPGSILPAALLQFCNVDFWLKRKQNSDEWEMQMWTALIMRTLLCQRHTGVQFVHLHREKTFKGSILLVLLFFLKEHFTRNFIHLNHSQRIL